MVFFSVKARLKNWFDDASHFVRSREFKNLIKSTIAYLLSVCVFIFPEHLYNLVYPLHLHILQLPMGVLLNDPSRSVGAMFESSFYYLISVMATGLICYLCVPNLVHSTFLLLLFFFTMILVISGLKASYPKQLTSTMNVCTLIVLYSVLNSFRDYADNRYDKSIIICQVQVFLLSGIISWLVNVLIFPRWAGDDLRRSMKDGLKSLGLLLAVMAEIVQAAVNVQNSNFSENANTNGNIAEEKDSLLSSSTPMKNNNAPLPRIADPKWRLDIRRRLASAIGQSRSNFSKITALLEESRLEISYSTFDRYYYDAFTVIIRRLLRHLASIASSCERMLEWGDFSINHLPNSVNTAPPFLHFMRSIHNDLMLFTDISMMELRYIYNKFQSHKKQDLFVRLDKMKQQRQQPRGTGQRNTFSSKSNSALRMTTFTESSRGTSNEPWDHQFYNSRSQIPVDPVPSTSFQLMTPLLLPKVTNETAANPEYGTLLDKDEEEETEVPTNREEERPILSQIFKRVRKLLPKRKKRKQPELSAIELVSAKEDEQVMPQLREQQDDDDEGGDEDGDEEEDKEKAEERARLELDRNNRKMAQMFPNNFGDLLVETVEEESSGAKAGSEIVSSDVEAKHEEEKQTILPAATIIATPPTTTPIFPPNRLRSYSSTANKNSTKSPFLINTSDNNYQSQTLRTKRRKDAVKNLYTIRNSSVGLSDQTENNNAPRTGGVFSMSLADAIECIKKHQKNVIVTYIKSNEKKTKRKGKVNVADQEIDDSSATEEEDELLLQGSSQKRQQQRKKLNQQRNNNGRLSLSEVMDFIPKTGLGGSTSSSGATASDNSSEVVDNLDDLFVIFSFLLCLSNFGEKLNMLGERTRMMARNKKNQKALYVPWLWNDPRTVISGSGGGAASSEDDDNDAQFLNSPKLEDLPPSPGKGQMDIREERKLFWEEGKRALLETFFNVKSNSSKASEQEDQEAPSLKKNQRSNAASQRTGSALSNWLKKAQNRMLTFFVGKFRTQEYKYALRVAILTTFGSVFAFLEETRDAFHEWKGNWALFSIAIVTSSNVGSSTSMGFWRTLGTIFGSFAAFMAWTLFPSIAYRWAHLIFTLVFAIPVIHLRLHTKYVRLSNIILIAYTIVLFGKSNQEILYARGNVDPDSSSSGTTAFIPEDIWHLFYKRTLTILVGVLIGIIGTLSIFPSFARTALRTQSAAIIKRLCQLYSNVSLAILCGLDQAYGTSLKQFLALEFDIQMSLIKAQELVQPSSTEFSFDGHQFPSQIYKRLLDHCQSMLDDLLANRLAASLTFSDYFRSNVLTIAHHERKLVLGCSILYFSVLHGALTSKSPLPPLLPDVDKARFALRQRLQSIPDLMEKMLRNEDYHYLFVSASQRELVLRMRELALDLKALFGVMDEPIELLEQKYISLTSFTK